MKLGGEVVLGPPAPTLEALGNVAQIEIAFTRKGEAIHQTVILVDR